MSSAAPFGGVNRNAEFEVAAQLAKGKKEPRRGGVGDQVTLKGRSAQTNNAEQHKVITEDCRLPCIFALFTMQKPCYRGIHQA